MIHQGLKQRWSAHPRRNSIVAVVAVLVVVVAGFGVTRAIGGDSSAATTRNVEVTSGALQETVSGSGTIAAASTEDLNFELSGEVTAVYVSEGQKVKKNQVLAEIDSASLRTQVAQASASVASAESKLASDEDAGASAAQISADKASLAAARSEQRVAESNLAGATLRSPIKGTVSALSLVEGQYISSSSAAAGSSQPSSGGSTNTSAADTSTSTPQVQVISTGSYVVNLSVDDTQISKLSEGDQATITVAGTTEKVFGTVSSVGLIATTTSGVSSFPVVAAITGSPKGLYAGSTAQVSIVYRQINGATQVPSLAVNQEGDKNYVQLVTGDDVEKREVTTGVSAGGQTQVLAGLAVGDQVQIVIPAVAARSADSGGPGVGGLPGGGGSGGFPGGGSGGPPAGFTGGFPGGTP